MSNMVKRDSNKSLNVSPRGSVYRVHVSNLSAVDGSNQKSINSPVEVTRLVVEIPLIKRRVWDTSPSQVVGLGIFEPSAVTLVKLSVFFDQLGTGFVYHAGNARWCHFYQWENFPTNCVHDIWYITPTQTNVVFLLYKANHIKSFKSFNKKLPCAYMCFMWYRFVP